MPSNGYHFITRWRVRGAAEEVYELISHPRDFPRWWPSVYLQVQEIAAGDASGIGRRVDLHTKGWLPYTLHWESCSTEAVKPKRLALDATGDFLGCGIWTFEQDGDFVNVVFDWELTADKPLLRYLSFLLKPVFSANHRWAMDRGLESLKLELAREQAATSQERECIPAPPGPNRTSGLWLAAGGAAIVSIIAGSLRFLMR